MFLDRHLDSKAAAAAALIASTVACGNDSSASRNASDAALAEAGAPERTYAPTFSAVWSEVLYASCGASYCHAGDQTGLMLMAADQAYDDLVGALPRGVDCKDSGLTLVEPRHPESSLIYLKLVAPPCGALMPRLIGRLPERDIAQVRRWIELGALKD
ncbi:MAG TPA: hypothetical protein VI072_36425 [Polyangiaceae bacterium]